MRTAHLFAGAGGSLIAGALLGHTAVAAVEHDEWCCRLLEERWPGLAIWQGDVRGCDYTELRGRVDCIMAGWPCVDVSRIGSGDGLDGEGSGLWSEVARAIGYLGPDYALLENGPDLPARGLDRVVGDLACLGYDIRWCVLGASSVGARHRRARWYGLAYAMRLGLEGQQQAGGSQGPALGGGTADGAEWSWPDDPAQSPMDRVADGLAGGVREQLQAIGNGWCPLQAAVAWRLLGGP